MTGIENNLAYKIMVDYKADLINRLYFILLEISKLNPQSKWP